MRHARAITFQLAEVAVTGAMVRSILAAVHRLRALPSCARPQSRPIRHETGSTGLALALNNRTVTPSGYGFAPRSARRGVIWPTQTLLGGEKCLIRGGRQASFRPDESLLGDYGARQK